MQQIRMVSSMCETLGGGGSDASLPGLPPEDIEPRSYHRSGHKELNVGECSLIHSFFPLIWENSYKDIKRKSHLVVPRNV